MSDLIETHSTCPICGLRISLTETGKMRKNPKHEKCIGDGKSHKNIQSCLSQLSFINDINSDQIPFTKEDKEFVLAVLNQNLGSSIASNFPDIPGDDYRKIRHSKFSKFQKDRYSREHADEIIARFRQAVTSSRAAMGTSKEP